MNDMRKVKMPKKPCMNCVYFAACGSTTRKEPCNGRKTLADIKRENRIN